MASHGVPRPISSRARTQDVRERELEAINQYKSLVDSIESKITNNDLGVDTLTLTTEVLTRNPEYYTIWNHRRRILQKLLLSSSSRSIDGAEVGALPPTEQPPLDIVRKDLDFLVPLLIQFPKCYWIWNHRLWLLRQSSMQLPRENAKRLWREELTLVGKMLHKDSRNFHGWGYRRFIVMQLEQGSQQCSRNERVDGPERDPSMVEDEFAYTTRMIRSNLSNFSAWHYRSKLIPRVLNERGADTAARRTMLDDEFSLVQRALYTDPYDQSLWFYYDFLMGSILSRATMPTILGSPTDDDRKVYLERELVSLRDMLEGTDDCKWIYSSLLQYSAAYLKVRGSNRPFTDNDVHLWLSELRRLDPLRNGRWKDLALALDS